MKLIKVGNKFAKVGGNMLAVGGIDWLNSVLPSGLKAVDMGTLNWTYYSDHFTVKIPDIVYGLPAATYSPCVVCDKYATSKISGIAGVPDKTIAQGSGNNMSSQTIAVGDSDYTDAATFKQAMQGVVLIYKTV